MHYYYYSYNYCDPKTGDFTGNAVAEFIGEFDLVAVHRTLHHHLKTCAIVLFWNEISVAQYEKFVTYTREVQGGDKAPQILKLIKAKE